MKYETVILALAGLASAREVALYQRTVSKREVPQEHSHEAILRVTNTNMKLNNPNNIVDAVFGLLGNAAASKGLGSIKNPDCLQQATADQAFTNAKAAGDVNGMANAIMYRALERNTGAIGRVSAACNETAVNPEIAAIKQHQDPASDAAPDNKQIELDVAKQLAAIGADPQLALQTGTFPPGDKADFTAKGKTCDDANDAVGCIITQNLLTPLATAADITATVGAGGAAAGGAAPASNSTACPAGSNNATTGNKAAADNTASTGNTGTNNAADSSATAGGASGKNVQTFTGSLGGAPPPVIETTGAARPFSVNGDTFVNSGAALQRSCAIQHNACANAANSGTLAGGVGQCETQEQACNAARGAKKQKKRAAVFFA